MLWHPVNNHLPSQSPLDAQGMTAIFEMAFDASFELDRNAHICAWNPRAEKLFGWSCADVIGERVQMIVLPRHRQKFLLILQEIIASGVEQVPQEPMITRGLHRDGHRFSVDLLI